MRPYARAKQIFSAALELAPEARADFVASECHGDPALEHEVLSLLSYHDGGTLPGEDAPLQRVGPYRVKRTLGEGGMGRVLLAEDDAGRPVALKLLRRELMTPDLVARFGREAEALTRLDHPGIARLLGSGVETTPAGPQHWLALEYVEGESLTAWAAHEPSEAERLELITHLCDAIQHAHAQGVVHRDLKPENVIVRADGRPALLDFGIARFTDADLRATVALTHTGLLMGTVRYMSPEQAEGRAEDVGARSDLYSLAVMTYELLAGRLPYDLTGKSVHSALATLMTAEPLPLTELPGQRRKGLERVLGKALEKSPDSRYASVAEFTDDLRRVMSGHAPKAPPRRRPLWRRRDVRVGVMAAGLMVIAALMVLAVNDRLSRQDPRRQWPLLNDELTRANELIQLGSRTREDLVRALALLESAESRINSLPRQPWTDEVQQFATFRRGEAELFLGRKDMDPARAQAAALAFQRAQQPERLLPKTIPLPDRSALWVSQADALTSTDARATWGAALSDLAVFQGPATILNDVLGKESSALGEAENVVLRAGGPGHLAPGDPAIIGRGFRQHGLAGAEVALADVNGRSDRLGYAFELMREAFPTLQRHAPPASVASIQHTMGWAYLVRSRTHEHPADLDSAETRLRAAFGWRLAQAGNLSRNETVTLLARVALLRAAAARDVVTRVRLLEEARVLLARVWHDVPADAHALHRALLEYPLAEVEMRLAEASGDRAWLARADSMLAAPSWMPTREREPVVLARRERVMALADLVAATRFGDTRRAQSLHEHVANALYAVPREEWPVLAEELEAMEREVAETR